MYMDNLIPARKTMEETKFIWMDGKLIDWKESKIHVLTHSLHYGSGVFEGIRFYNTAKGPAIFRLKEHVERLFNSALVLNMEIPFSKEEITKAIIETVKINGISVGYIRPLIYFGYGKMGLGIKDAPVNVIVACWPWGSYLGEDPIKAKISSFKRINPQTSWMHAKITGHYANSILAGEEVKRLGYHEALLLDSQGNIAEGPGENFFIVKGNFLLTPPLGAILPGITRDSIMQISKDFEISVREQYLTPEDTFNAEEAFFTGTAAEVTPIKSINDHPMKYPLGPISKKLMDEYHNIVQGKNSKYAHWLTYVN